MSEPVFKGADADADESVAARLGRSLQYEREKRGMSAQEIAQELRLSVAVIHDLEAGNADALPEPVYVRGYVRAYCRLLKIGPEPLLVDFVLEPAGREEDDFLPAMNEHVHRLTRLWGSLAVFSVIILLVSLWWMEQPRRFAELPPTPESIPKPGASIPKPGASIPKPGALIAKPGASIPKPGALIAKPGASIPKPGALIAKPGASIPKPGASIPKPGASAPKPIPAPASEQAGQTPDDDLVEVTVVSSDRSWAHLTDGSGEVIINRMLFPGYRGTIRGVFPLDFKFGDARSVRVWVDGVEYDLEKHISKLNTAFFKIEESVQQPRSAP